MNQVKLAFIKLLVTMKLNTTIVVTLSLAKSPGETFTLLVAITLLEPEVTRSPYSKPAAAGHSKARMPKVCTQMYEGYEVGMQNVCGKKYVGK